MVGARTWCRCNPDCCWRSELSVLVHLTERVRAVSAWPAGLDAHVDMRGRCGPVAVVRKHSPKDRETFGSPDGRLEGSGSATLGA